MIKYRTSLGMELSHDFYIDEAKDLIADTFVDCMDRIAVGLVGEGSICYEFDDHISRDHDWGPGFCIWLNRDDFHRVGHMVQALYEGLPVFYKGYQTLLSGSLLDQRVGVFEINSFYKKFLGVSSIPISVEKWMSMSEASLSAATNGKIFTDPDGQFSFYRNYLLEHYPEAVRQKRMAFNCLTAGQTGQYNFDRSLKRGEQAAALLAKAKFIESSIAIIFLLNKVYRPFYKWIHHGLQQLQILGEEGYRLITGMTKLTPGISMRGQWLQDMELIEELSLLIIGELQKQGISSSSSDFLMDHGVAINNSITDNSLRKLPVRVETI